jgi:hypothetical protein
MSSSILELSPSSNYSFHCVIIYLSQKDTASTMVSRALGGKTHQFSIINEERKADEMNILSHFTNNIGARVGILHLPAQLH